MNKKIDEVIQIQYGKNWVHRIADEMAKGRSPLEISKDPLMPDYQMMLRWRDTYPYCAAQWCKAIFNRVEVLTEELLELPKLLIGNNFKTGKVKFKTYTQARDYVNARTAALKFVIKELKKFAPDIQHMSKMMQELEKGDDNAQATLADWYKHVDSGDD